MSLENRYKKIANFSNKCINTFVSVLKILVQSKFKIKLPEATEQTCIVLGNGPSLKRSLELHTASICKHPVICVNSFSMTEDYTILKPRYYVMLDPVLWQKKTEVFNNTFKCLEERTQWPLILFVPQYAYKNALFVKLAKENKNITIQPFNYTVFKGFSSVAYWCYKKNLGMPQSLNVIIPALFLGLNMGYKQLFIFGTDHTWHENLHVGDDNVLSSKQFHFYEDKSEVKYLPVNMKVHEFFDIWSRTFYGYIQLSQYAKHLKSVIYNASDISFIDAFERKKL